MLARLVGEAALPARSEASVMVRDEQLGGGRQGRKRLVTDNLGRMVDLLKNILFSLFFIWLCWVSAEAYRIFSCGVWDLVP